MFPAICRDRLPRHHAGGGAHHIRMESTLMIYKSKFINTSRCGAGFPWLLAHPTPTCTLGHPQLHGPAAGMDIYIPLRYWNTSTWVPYGCVHLHVHPDTYTRISTRTMALWRHGESCARTVQGIPPVFRKEKESLWLCAATTRILCDARYLHSLSADCVPDGLCNF